MSEWVPLTLEWLLSPQRKANTLFSHVKGKEVLFDQRQKKVEVRGGNTSGVKKKRRLESPWARDRVKKANRPWKSSSCYLPIQRGAKWGGSSVVVSIIKLPKIAWKEKKAGVSSSHFLLYRCVEEKRKTLWGRNHVKQKGFSSSCFLPASEYHRKENDGFISA